MVKSFIQHDLGNMREPISYFFYQWLVMLSKLLT
jgi:hypothetical protein